MSPLPENDKTLTNKDLPATSPVVDRNMDSINQNIAQSQAKIDTSALPPDLAEIVDVWPKLPEHIKAAIKTLVEAHKGKEWRKEG